MSQFHLRISGLICEALGFLQVSYAVQILINFDEYHDSNPRLAFDNFVKDCNSKNLGFQSYSEYMCHIIDAMIEQIDENTSNDATGRQTVMGAVESTAVRRHISPDHICHQFDAPSDVVIRDFHDSTKTRGFLTGLLPLPPPPCWITSTWPLSSKPLVYLITSSQDSPFSQD